MPGVKKGGEKMIGEVEYLEDCRQLPEEAVCVLEGKGGDVLVIEDKYLPIPTHVGSFSLLAAREHLYIIKEFRCSEAGNDLYWVETSIGRLVGVKDTLGFARATLEARLAKAEQALYDLEGDVKVCKAALEDLEGL